MRDATWLHSLPPAPPNAARADEIDYDRITPGNMPVWVTADIGNGPQQLPAVATGWTREHVRVEVKVPHRGTMLLWFPAGDIARRD